MNDDKPHIDMCKKCQHWNGSRTAKGEWRAACKHPARAHADGSAKYVMSSAWCKLFAKACVLAVILALAGCGTNGSTIDVSAVHIPRTEVENVTPRERDLLRELGVKDASLAEALAAQERLNFGAAAQTAPYIDNPALADRVVAFVNRIDGFSDRVRAAGGTLPNGHVWDHLSPFDYTYWSNHPSPNIVNIHVGLAGPDGSFQLEEQLRP